MLKFLSLLLVLSLSAHAEQRLNCYQVNKDGSKMEDGVTVRVLLQNETGPVKKITGKISTTGVWKKTSGWGKGEMWLSDQLNKIYEYQHGDKPTVVFHFTDVEQQSIEYRFYFNNENLGQKVKGVHGHLWVDPDAPEGGGWPHDLKCNSSIKE
jgi:hypothetical protein